MDTLLAWGIASTVLVVLLRRHVHSCITTTEYIGAYQGVQGRVVGWVEALEEVMGWGVVAGEAVGLVA